MPSEKSSKSQRLKSKTKSKSKSAQSISPEILRKTRRLLAKSIINKKINPSMRMKRYLTVMCPSSGECIGFGKERAMINRFFEGFVNMEYASPEVNVISEGSNGRAILIKHEKDEYVAYTIIKTSIKEESDNLVYEAMVGLKYINTLIPYYPCFLETYSAMKFNSAEESTALKDVFSPLDISSPDKYVEACINPTHNVVLIEYAVSPVSLENKIKMIATSYASKRDMERFANLSVLTYLFQIYSVLASISGEYTHYDLHAENVLLFPVPNGNRIRMIYHHPEGHTTEFDTPYVAKIIDYGRNYCPFSGEYYKSICDNKATCTSHSAKNSTYTPLCGLDSGHNFFNPAIDENDFYISMLQPNVSHDLRCATIVRDLLRNLMYRVVWPETLAMLNSVMYSSKYGTPPIKFHSPGTIHNVKDMSSELSKFIRALKVPQSKVVGIMHIYLDRSSPLTFHQTEP